MLNRLLLLLCVLVIAMGMVVVEFPFGVSAIALVFFLSAIAILAFRHFTEEKEFITIIFLVGLALRMAFGVFIHVFDLREFFGGDAYAYDLHGARLSDIWLGRDTLSQELVFLIDTSSGAGWGMYYVTGAIYALLGRNIFAAQSFCAVIGAATAPMVYFCAKKIFNNISVAKASAIAIAVFPSFIIWSGQLLKDGPIIFLLVTAMTMVLALKDRISYPAVATLVIALFGILTMRFYIFYMAAVAVVGSFVIGLSASSKTILRNTVILGLVGFGLMYMGVGQTADTELRVFGNLERVQSSRLDLAQKADTGFGTDVDVSTAEGALSAIPLGFAYLMFAPFPWQAANLRQAITIPEILVWWATIPFLIMGLIYTIRNKLRAAFPILIFSLMLTIAYSVFQGNVGTAYRQRTQIQVFLFMLVGVGWTLHREQKENKRMVRVAAQQRVNSQLRGHAYNRETI